MSNPWPELDLWAEEMGSTRIQGFPQPSPVDISDILPSDPFEMSASEEITASVEGFNAEFQSHLMDSKNGDFDGNSGGGELNWLCSRRVRLFPELDNIESDGKQHDGFSIDNDGYRLDESGTEEVVSQSDVADSLPSDPFGMDVSTFWGITGSLEESEDIDWSYESVNNRESDDGLVFGLNLLCRSRVRFMPDDAGNDESDSKQNSFSFERVIDANDLEADSVHSDAASISDERHGGEPHYAMFLALPYLGVKDLLSVEMVCRSLNHAVKGDPSMWMNVNIDHPLDNLLTDRALIKLTSRACGLLKSLTMMGCFQITNAAIRHIVHSNPCLTKLSVLGGNRLSVEDMLATFKSARVLSLKQLRIGGLCVTSEQYEHLKTLLHVDDQLSRPWKPLYYHGHSYGSYKVDDDRPIDVEKCPRCSHVRMVYDCPSESCQKSDIANSCKACFLCIRRCMNCGCCLTNGVYLETFGLNAICMDCIFKQCQLYQVARYLCFVGW